MTYLPGLDGLRAVSVLAVLLYHAELLWIPGGYLGVEVFFVISGYLITRLLLSEWDGAETISLRHFWLRRARRLLPALYVLLLVTTVTAISFYREELVDLRGQLVAALTYVTNWYLIVVDASYFDVVGRPLALQHLWSLAVEEQFYLVWPLLVLGMLRLFRGRLGPMAVLIGAGAAGSALLMAALYEPGLDPSRVYYGTDTRASGLLLGALVALFWRPVPADPAALRRRVVLLDVAGLVGLAGVVVAFLRLEETDPFLYRGGFVVVSLCSLLAVAAVVHPGSVLGGRAALGTSVLTWIGIRSYGLYLWHWPIYIVTRPGIDVPWGVYPTLALRLALTVVAAEVSYRYVEVPVRRGALRRWFASLGGGAGPGRDARRRVAAAALVAIAVVASHVGTSLAGATRPIDEVERAVRFGQVAAPPTGEVQPTGGNAGVQAGPASTAVEAGSNVPGVVPTPVTVAPRTVTMLGDSVLLGARPSLIGELGADGWTVDFRGEPALMLKEAAQDLRAAGQPVGDVVVVGLGYNTLWEKNRRNYDQWAERFDTEADALVDVLRELGARRIVWVTLREPSAEVVPAKGRTQYRRYAWYFPYVNERLRQLDQREADVVLADWAAVSNRSGLTYDAIHLSGEGVRLMIDVIRTAAGV